VYLQGTCAIEEEDELPDLEVLYCKRDGCDGITGDDDFVNYDVTAYEDLNKDAKDFFDNYTGQILEVEVCEVPDHNYGPWRVRNLPDEQGPGYWFRQCLKCGHHEEWIEDYAPDCGEGYHKYEEENVPATCENAGYILVACVTCGAEQSYEEIPALGHQFEVETQDATCTEAGYSKEICSVCGAIGEETEIPALGHQFEVETQDPTCTEAGLSKEICSVCGAIGEETEIPALGHTPGEPVKENEVPATIEAEGSYEEVINCAVCGAEISRTSVVIPKLKNGLVEEEDGRLRLYESDVPSTANGLTLVDEEQNDWYYLANGYVDQDFTGWANKFSRQWMIEDGKLVNDNDGLVDFEGETWAVSEGMLWTNWTGIWWKDGTPYLLAAGQWQKTFSGIYPDNDGNLILVKDGIMDMEATSYTIKGVEYPVVNGIINMD
jgi:hypothetical protein